MNNKVIGTIKKYNMLSYGERVLIAVSGGADSMALLNILLEVRDEYNLDIEVAHIEHGIRGEESESDALFVSDFCKRNKIVFHIKSINAVEEAKEAKMGVEEYSRQVRYDFFNSLECDKIATAHSLSDSIETTVFRLIRGSGLKGVCGISPVRGKIIRPLIECTSSEIREFCKEKNIDYCIDSTNNDNSYSRNYIRNVLLPQFCEINSDYEKAIGVFVADSAEDYSFIEKTAQIEYKNCLCKKGLLIEKLKNLDNAIVK
ncbi:MAG: tRNA lysidine(34) synthetase TilS, partial [Clostridiales bacterium]|nr:tRNA lysidine(34) synthetase TilS [Clostridiales bacterium]